MKIETQNARYVHIPALGIIINEEIEKHFSHLIPPALDEAKIIAGIKRKITDQFIDKHVKCARTIVLCLTEQCNFRCRYCSYSGNYNGIRTHSKKKMSLDTAKKMFDLIVRLAGSEERSIRNNHINVSFYGGEPLLEIQLIRDIMDYAQQLFIRQGIDHKFKPRYRLSTNGYLLNKETVDFLVDRDVLIDISLDGPQEEHDKFRVTASGEKTWETIMANLEYIRSRYPDYYKDRVKFLCTIHPLHDYGKIDNFYICDNNLFYLDKVQANFVGMSNLKKEIKQEIDKKKKTQESLLYNIGSFKRLDDKLTMKRIDYDTYFTQMCFPGKTKIYVDTDGLLHICEKIKFNLPIGDVDNGLDYDKIRNILDMWADCIIRFRCWECPAWSICPVCLASMSEEKGDAQCTAKERVFRRLKEYIEYKENGKFAKITSIPSTAREYIASM